MNTLQHRLPARARGAAMLLVLAFTIIGGIGITAWAYLLAARSIQADRMSDAVARHIAWGNSAAINQQFALTYTFRKNITKSAVVGTVPGGGGFSSDAFSNINAFSSAYYNSSPATIVEPFDNLRALTTPDGSAYYTVTTGDSDPSQADQLHYYNYQKTYPRPLLGDLLVVHTKPPGALFDYVTDNLMVDGRIVVYDSATDISGVEANEVLNLTKTGTNTCLNLAGTASILPSNYPARPFFTAGDTAAGTGAVLDGTLKMCNNPDFTPGSIYHILRTLSPGYYVLNTTGTPASLTNGCNIDSNNNGGVTGTTKNGGSSSSDIWVKTGDKPPTGSFSVPSTSPYGYSWPKGGSAVQLLLKSSTLYHVELQNGATQLVLQGQTSAADYTAASTLPPLVILVTQEIRDIRFVGENSRPLVLAIGPGTGQTCFMSWSGSTTASGGGPLRWRLHLINEYRDVWLDTPSGTNVTITGSFRTNWNINCTDATATDRFFLTRDTNPGTLPFVLPRDAWFEPVVTQ